MVLLFIILGIVAVAANVVMDELHTHYERFFQKVIPKKWDSWWNPSVSWQNKYIAKSKILTFIFSTLLSFCTDAWHFFKMIFLTSAVLIGLLLENGGLKWWQYGVELLAIGLVWGIMWELINGIIGAISDKLKNE
jgi:hypothetical protein